MRPVVALPDAEMVTLGYLRPALLARPEAVVSGFKTGVVVPSPIPMPFVRVRRAGGVSATPGVDLARIDVQVWHDTDFKRMELAQLVRALLKAAAGDYVGGNQIYFASEFLGPIPMPDPADPSKRVVMFTHELLVR